MAVAMQSQHVYSAGAIEAAAYAIQRLCGHAAIGCIQIRRYETVRQQIVTRFLAEAGNVQLRAMDKLRIYSDGMYASDETAQPLQRIWIVQLGRAAAAARKYRETKAAVFV